MTKVAALVGYPATYSLSPALHNAAYQHMGFDALYVVFPTKPEDLAGAVHGARSLGLLGMSVTIPHKEAIVSLCDELSADAQALHAVNTVVFNDGRIIGHNTDGAGFIRSLVGDLQFDALHKRCVVIGAGGSARAVVNALGRAGAADVVVISRSPDRAEETAALAGSCGHAGSIEDIAAADLVVNCTPVGMTGEHEGQSPIPLGLFQQDQVVVDLIYSPAETAFLADAAATGARTANGLGMLIHQAALQIELWTGGSPSIAAMQAAVTTER
jgi:shikimate dehydrogenase